jgi:hypothetical protein
MRSYIAIVAVLAAVLAVSGARAVPAATDFSCPSSVASDFDGMEWTPGSGDISGVRAPIEMRFDGLVCGGGPEEAFASSWIAIESSFLKLEETGRNDAG